TSQDQSMPDASSSLPIPRQPGDRPNRPRNKQKPIRISQLPPGQKPSKKCCHGQPGKIVVRQGWMTRMRRYQDFFGGRARQKAFRPGEVAILKRRINAYLILRILELPQSILRKAETPVFPVIGRSIGNPVRMFGKSEQTIFEFAEQKPGA